jgi:hypothetical protein
LASRNQASRFQVWTGGYAAQATFVCKLFAAGKFELASRGASAYLKLRFVPFLENGTHVLLSGRMGSYRTGEITLAKEVVPQLKPGMLCLADRFFFGFTLWTKAQASGCELLWRVRICGWRYLNDGAMVPISAPFTLGKKMRDTKRRA